MHAVAAFLSPRSFGRAFVLLAVGLVAANCSSDAVRLNENPFASNAGPAETTGSVPPGQIGSAGQIETRPLGSAQMSSQPLPPPAGRGPGTYGYGGGMADGGRGMASFQPGDNGPEVTGAVPRLHAGAKPRRTWNWEGGTPITVAPGDTLASLSRRYGVPAQAIAEANGLSGPAALRPGQHLVIPRYSGAAAPGPRVARPQAAPAATRAPLSSVHIVAPGETLVGIAKRYHVSITLLAAANKIAPYTRVKMGDRLVIPGRHRSRTADATPEVRPASAPVAAAPPARKPAPLPRTAEATPKVEAQEPAKNSKVASIDPTSSIRMVKPTHEANDDRPSNGGTPAFRWPVRGRVITSFGTKVNGQRNDGIDLAVPEGTAVRAADDGVVAYAGNELKGYGNLVLVKHSNGFVTAYAHASEIMVKRNEKVRRGQIIAKSGETGNVSGPQLHFEIRKGSSPVDPLQHLPHA
jgi:murein DD-endopeptidase MepM/ murein hydrolase activator NlpD